MLPVEHNDPINAKILAISEDKIEGFVREPFEKVANRSGVGVDVVMARIAAMLRAGTIRRVRQTLLATNLAHYREQHGDQRGDDPDDDQKLDQRERDARAVAAIAGHDFPRR